MLVCAFLCATLHTRPRVQRAPGLPCALFSSGGSAIRKPRAHSAARTRMCIRELFEICIGSLTRHCEPPGRANARPMTGSAKQSISQLAETWIASSQVLLAMTLRELRRLAPPNSRQLALAAQPQALFRFELDHGKQIPE